MPPGRRYALVLAGFSAVVLGSVAAAGWLVWDALDPATRQEVGAALGERALAVGLVAVGLVVVLGWALAVPFRAYVLPARRLLEGGRVALLANREHRVRLDRGAPELVEVAALLNALAERAATAAGEVDARVDAAKQELAEERNRLAALMAQLPLGVVVCHRGGRILLYNEEAAALLQAGEDAGFVGVGRSLHGLVDPDAIALALAEADRRRRAGEEQPVVPFVVAAGGARLLRAQLSPVPVAGQPGGYVLTLDDVTRRVEAGDRREALLRSLTERTRAAVGTIRAAVEAVAGYPDMDPAQREGFTGIIASEAVRLGEDLAAADAAAGAHLDARWPLDDLLASDLLAVLGRRLEAVWRAPCALELPDAPLWLRADSHALVQVLGSLAGRVAALGEVRDVVLRAWAREGLARVEVEWSGAAPDLEAFAGWEASRAAGEERLPLTLKEVVERHAGEVLYSAPAGGRAILRLLLPVSATAGDAGGSARREQRVAGYDLRLLQGVDRRSDLDACPLDELTCTVLDTETTGLSPDEGDEVVALAAVRIVHGRLLRHERFSHLVDPGRPVPAAATRIHGLDDMMLRGRPPLAAVLPAFARFCEETVLVGHNVAFDLRFLQREEARTGVALAQPVLDTLLLSAVVAPEQRDHALEAVAERLGIEVIARHTALGDALLTAEVLLGLLPLLGERGVTTLGEARAASEAIYATLQP